MRYILIILSLLLYSCDDSTTEAEVIVDCCHEWAWNYNHDTTEHDDNLCIFNFGFSYPSGGNAFNDTGTYPIAWEAVSSVDGTPLTSDEEPGDSDISISLSVLDSETETEQFVISDCTENEYTCNWTIDASLFLSFCSDGESEDQATCEAVMTCGEGEDEACTWINGFGDKKLYILQDLNTDDVIDQDSVLSAFSPVFTINEAP